MATWTARSQQTHNFPRSSSYIHTLQGFGTGCHCRSQIMFTALQVRDKWLRYKSWGEEQERVASEPGTHAVNITLTASATSSAIPAPPPPPFLHVTANWWRQKPPPGYYRACEKSISRNACARLKPVPHNMPSQDRTCFRPTCDADQVERSPRHVTTLAARVCACVCLCAACVSACVGAEGMYDTTAM